MRSSNCEEITFKSLADLPDHQRQAIQSTRSRQYEPNRYNSLFYHILHDGPESLALSIAQGCHLYNVIYVALNSRGYVSSTTHPRNPEKQQTTTTKREAFRSFGNEIGVLHG